MVRIFGLHQNSLYLTESPSKTTGTLRCIVSFSVSSTTMEKGPMKSRPDYHRTTRAIVSMNKEAGQNTKSMRRNNYREDLVPEGRLAFLALIQLETIRRGEPNLRCKFHTKASPRIRRRACLGKPRSINSYI